MLLEQYDVVLWMGDLNYRINGNTAAVRFLIDKSMPEVLVANDQLNIQRAKGKVFRGFQEQAIAFAPTFKLRPRTDDYNDARVPSWTDRVLYMCVRA